MDLDQQVSPDSFVYREVVRLYRIARSLRPVVADRWTGRLDATSADTMGGLNPRTGVLRLSADRVLPYLTGAVSPTHRRQQAQALATVLHEATHGAMQIKAPGEPNAVVTEHSRGVMEGFAEVRTFADFDAFADRAGYAGLTLSDPQYPGAFAATRDLMAHITGPSYSKQALISDTCRGPGLMHFDQFARSVVANQLHELVRRDETEQRAVRAALIQPMLHAHWPTLPNVSAATGELVAREIRSALDAKVDEIRRDHRLTAPLPTGGDPRTAAGAHRDTQNGLRFLTSQAPPTGAVTQRPQLGQGSRRPGPTPNPHGRSGHPPPHTRD